MTAGGITISIFLFLKVDIVIIKKDFILYQMK